MDIKVSGRKTTVTDALRAHVDEKIGEALKVFDIEPMNFVIFTGRVPLFSAFTSAARPADVMTTLGISKLLNFHWVIRCVRTKPVS